MKTKQTLVCGTRNLCFALAAIFALAFIACDDGSSDDKTGGKKYTVTFDSNGGSDVDAQTVTEGGKAAKPADPTKASGLTAGLWAGTPGTSTYAFSVWQKDGAAYDFNAPVTANITLTAAWTETSSGTPINLATRSEANIIEKSIAYINDDTETAYTLVLNENLTVVEKITHNKDSVTLTITSDGTTERIISMGTTNAAVFTVGGTMPGTGIPQPKKATLVIDGNITLQGKDLWGESSNYYSLVEVMYGGSLELKGNAKITGNMTNSPRGGGVVAWGDSPNARVTITMSGNAEISDNMAMSSSPEGGGVCLYSAADLTMSENASIKNNGVVGNTTLATNNALGGGVYIYALCTFTMNGGEISGNYAIYSDGGTAQGGGVFIYGENNARFIVASEAVKANIKDNYVISNDGIEKSEQVYKQNRGNYNLTGEFLVGNMNADTY
jgi:hypothetical protein